VSLTVTVAVNGQPIERLWVTNRGPVSEVEGDDPGGLREYEWVWSADGNELHGTVVHARRDGALRLVALAVAAVLDFREGPGDG
jgi:hypothetical protein